MLLKYRSLLNKEQFITSYVLLQNSITILKYDGRNHQLQHVIAALLRVFESKIQYDGPIMGGGYLKIFNKKCVLIFGKK